MLTLKNRRKVAAERVERHRQTPPGAAPGAARAAVLAPVPAAAVAAAAAGVPAAGLAALAVVRAAAPAAALGAAAALAAGPVSAPGVPAAPVSAVRVRQVLRRRAPRVHGTDLQASGDDSQPGPLPTARQPLSRPGPHGASGGIPPVPGRQADPGGSIKEQLHGSSG